MDDAVLDVAGLSVDYLTADGPARAVNDVSFVLRTSEFMGIVGESGCGKSTLLFAIARLLSPPAEIVAGAVLFKGQNMVQMTDKTLRVVRWRNMSVVMQSAMNALNPVKTIAAQYQDAMQAHGNFDKAQVRQRSEEVLSLVGIDPVHLKSFPHQLSGGMRQRVMIAMALLFSPELVVMDEPTSALDIVAQRSLMLKVKELQRQLGFAIIFVTHDMSLVSHFSDRLAVMYAGAIVEVGDTAEVFAQPRHPYTQGLLEAFPSVFGPWAHLDGIPGAPPNLWELPGGCSFHPRCPKAMPRCSIVAPQLYDLDGQLVRCLLYEDGGRSGE